MHSYPSSEKDLVQEVFYDFCTVQSMNSAAV